MIKILGEKLGPVPRDVQSLLFLFGINPNVIEQVLDI